MQSPEDLSFLRFFLSEPIYLVPEAEVPIAVEKDEVPQKENLSVLEEEVPSVEVPQATSAPLSLPEIEGGNQKGVLVLFYDTESKNLSSNDKAFLDKILKAVSLSFEDIALCNWAPLEAAFEEQKNIFESLQKIKSDKILVFGDLPLAWSLSHFFQKYHITQEADGKKLLLADDLLKIAQNRELKVQLWNSLQKIFQ